jgi:hypothetical protein
VAIAGLSAAANLVAFCVVLSCPKDKWGDLMPFKGYLGFGALIGLIASVIAIVQLFKTG